METINLDIKNPKATPSIFAKVFKNPNCLPILFDIDKELFPEGFFSEAVWAYLFYKAESDKELNKEITSWLNKNKKSHWFNIEKDEYGCYYFLAGDWTGLKYLGEIDGISILVNGEEVQIKEDYYSYYIDAQQYNKDEWTLKDAIINELKNKKN